MSNFKMQIGYSLTSNFEENTWTFEMQEGFKVSAGEFVIIEKKHFVEMQEIISENKLGKNLTKAQLTNLSDEIDNILENSK